jgi:membrane dipeptidase
MTDSARAWMARNPPPLPDIKTVADHMDWIKQVAGVDHIGVGSDFDGIDIWPNGLSDVSTFPALIAELLRRGWTDVDVSKVIGGNALRVMRETEAVAARLQRERGPSVAQIEILDHWKTKPPLEGPAR